MVSTAPYQSSQAASHAFPIVGIGASAGGLEAFTQLLAHLPGDTGMAFILVQHLDPHHESQLTGLLARVSPVPVVEASHGLAIAPNQIYVIPPNANIAVADNHLHVTDRNEHGPHLPVDFLFRSLAESHQARSIGVVLSGTGSDGTLGLCEIKAVGGIALAQDEKSAKHYGMPKSAIDSGCVDFVLPPDQLAARLAEIGRHPYLSAHGPEAEEASADEMHFKAILDLVAGTTGVDFTLYRDTTIRRRIMRRMALHLNATLKDYVEQLRANPAEVEALYHDLLINVTSFFREPALFESIKTRVLPELLKVKSPTAPLRIWVPGCSTGQEAYSLAMTVTEFFDDKPVCPPIQIFATDLSDPRSLDRARGGVYPETIESEVSAARLRRFFQREDHQYRISKALRDICVFARHNVTSDPPFSHLDLVSCRNLLIYLAPLLQKRVLATFHFALNVPGFLVLGSAETVGDGGDLFEPVDRTHKIFRRKASAIRQHPFFPATDLRHLALRGQRPGSRIAARPDYEREAERMLLSRFAPPGVLVDDSFDIVTFRGRTSAYLEAPAGEPTTNVLKMAREGLFLELRNALTEAKKRNEVVRRGGVRVRVNGGTREVSVEVVPIRPQADQREACFMVLFHEGEPAAALAAETVTIAADDAAEAREVLQMRQELAATREYLQSLIEQQDAANEELRSANEEILSSNEELQSTNEELGTAKEELQSANEELTTVNEQLQNRNQELSQVNDDLTNLLSSTNIPVVMVGSDLRVRRFTPRAKKTLNLLPTDVGRPIGDIRPRIDVENLDELIGEVVDSVRPTQREVRDRDGHWYELRIYPYRTADRKVDGAVLVLVDIDQFRRDQEELRKQAEALRQQASLIELSRDAIIVREGEHRVTFWNRGATDTYGWRRAEALGQELGELLNTDPASWARLKKELEAAGDWEGELRQQRFDGTPILVYAREVLGRDAAGQQIVLSIMRDITRQRQDEESLREADRRKDEFLAVLAHELRNPLAPIAAAVEVLRRSEHRPHEQIASLDVIQRQVEQMSRIVEDLIDVRRIIEEKVELRSERVGLQCFTEVIEACRRSIEERGIRLHVDCPADPLQVTGDPVRLRQILMNLLNNAAKFTERGGTISVSVAKVAASGADEGRSGVAEMLELRVRDDGAGIAQPLLPHVFEMYVQGSGSDGSECGGLGIGLALVRSLVQMHGGQVEARSAGVGHGSEFVVRLPLADAATPSAVDRSRVRRDQHKPPPLKILVVDDNRDTGQVLGLLLLMDGHTVQVAESGPMGLEMADALEPDVAVIDIGMPGMSGLELGLRLRERFPNVLLIAQTGWGQESDRRRTHEAGFAHHLVKPILQEALDDILSAAFKSKVSTLPMH